MELTAEQRSALNWAIEAAVERGYRCDADALRKLLAAHSAGAQDHPLRAAVRSVVTMLKNGEYAEHWAQAEAPGDTDAAALEDAITELANVTPPPMTDAARDAERFAFLITNIKRYQLRESKGRWYYAPVASQDWQYGYASAREAIDAEIERGEKS